MKFTVLQLARLAGFLCLLGLVLSVLACNGPSPSHRDDHSSPGVSPTEILLGSSLPLTGHARYLGIQTLRGAMTYIDEVNNKGGVHGRKIRVVAYDDRYDPPMCLANTQRLIIEEQVFALFCYVGTPTTVKIIPMVEDARIPLLGMFTGANALREPFNRYIINVRASYYQETRAAVRHLVKDLGIENIAVFYQYDAYGFDGLTGTELALKEFGLAPVARGTYVRGTMDVSDGLQKIMHSGAEAVVMIGTYDPCAKFIQEALTQGFDPIFYTVSFVGADELARHFTEDGDEVILMSQVVPPPEGPETRQLLGSAAEYVQLMARDYPDDKPNFVGLEGYINARVLVEGLRRAGPNLTREGFIQAIESMDQYSLGGDTSISFSPRDHQGMERVYFTRLRGGQFVLVSEQDWQDMANEIEIKRHNHERFDHGMEAAALHDQPEQ
ncbi:MAG: hypothetical protein EOM25_02710 [Deltaproteobacteria bacterium]|nr:hypothetical protein [Deltaproteobacteria bacterium]